MYFILFRFFFALDLRKRKFLIIIVFNVVAIVIGIGLGFGLKHCDQSKLIIIIPNYRYRGSTVIVDKPQARF